MTVELLKFRGISENHEKTKSKCIHTNVNACRAQISLNNTYMYIHVLQTRKDTEKSLEAVSAGKIQ